MLTRRSMLQVLSQPRLFSPPRRSFGPHPQAPSDMTAFGYSGH